MEFELKGNFFDGQYIFPKTTGPEATEHFIERYCPSNLNQRLWKCLIDYSHVEPIIDSAKEGFQKWRSTKLEDRIQALKRYQEQVVLIKKELSRSISLETGKPLWESLIEVDNIITQVEICTQGSFPPLDTQTSHNKNKQFTERTLHKPIGPCAVIGPFNDPCNLVNKKILSALIAGNSIILKPSEKTCYSGQLLIDCFFLSGFPKGVINLIQGDGEIARRLVQNKEIKGVFFTGSKETGKKIVQSTYKDLDKVVSLNLGGKNVSLIFKDAHIENTLIELLKGCFLTTGQNCTSTALVAIHKDIQGPFIKKFHEMAKKIIVDHPLDHNKEPFMGPLADKKTLDNFLLFIGMAKREGIEEIMRGKLLSKKYRGHYVSPSIHSIDFFNPKSHFLISEILGPNCTFIPFDTIEESIKISNAVSHNLVSSVFTEDKGIFEYCVNEINTDYIHLNRSTIQRNPRDNFSNIQRSGNRNLSRTPSLNPFSYQLLCLEPEEESTIPPLKGLI